MFQLTIWSLPPLAVTLLASYAFVRARANLHEPGGTGLRLLLLAIVLWAGPQAVETLVISEAAKIAANQASYAGIALAPVAWFQFALTFSQRTLHVSRILLAAVATVPLATLALVVSTHHHQLIWLSWEVVESNGYHGLVTEHGFAWHINAFYSYALLLVATSILVFSLAQFKQPSRTVWAAILAPACVALANLYSLSPLNPWPWLDLTTLGFLFAAMILSRVVFAIGTGSQMPVVRHRVVEQLKDPVLVINHEGVILDFNRSAQTTWDTLDDELIGTPVTRLVPHLSLELLLNSAINSDCTINESSFEVATTPLNDRDPESDVALVFRDVTERRNSERKLVEMKDELERMAHTDALTNLFNRRFFMTRLNEEFERVKRHNSILSVLIFDLDHFKRINDSFGHDVGDAVLVSVSTVTNNVKRVTDVACRLGGEEFALLLPETDKAGALQMAHRLRRGVEDYPYLDLVGHDLAVTASIGVATVTKQTRVPEAVLKTADRALYMAKHGGRNMVCYDE